MRAVKARSLTDIQGVEHKTEETAALDERDPANGGELKPETADFNGHEAVGGAANGGEHKMETDALDEKMAPEQKEFAQYADAWDDKWGSSGFGLFHYMSE